MVIQGAQPEIPFYSIGKLQNHEQVSISKMVFCAETACKISIPFSVTWLMTDVYTRLIRAPSLARHPSRMNTASESLWKKEIK